MMADQGAVMRDKGEVLVIGLCAMDHPDPLAHDKSGRCPLRACETGRIVCPRSPARHAT